MKKSELILFDSITVDQDYEILGEPFQSLQLWQPHQGGIITIRDRNSLYFRARIIALSSGKAIVRVFEKIEPPWGDELEISLYQSLPDKERMEWIIQKTTELGVKTIIPFKSIRSISLEEREQKQKKAHCWSKIALRAAKQCRRADIPEVLSFCTFKDALSLAQNSQLKIILWEKEKGAGHLEDVLNKYREAGGISIMIGPEGGFTGEEIIMANEAGFEPIHLGPRILRTETASIVILSIIQFIFGDIR